jgi:inner membrane protein involved in colicin E2 resistance
MPHHALMLKRLVAIAFIFTCTSIAWLILGGTINSRTTGSDQQLRGKVSSIWGSPQIQTAPQAVYVIRKPNVETVNVNGKISTKTTLLKETRILPPSVSEIAVDLQSESRQKGLLWYATYRVGFRAEYVFHNVEPVGQTMDLVMHFPAAQAIYDDLQFVVDGTAYLPEIKKDRAFVSVDVPPGKDVHLPLQYRSQGLDTWRYSFGEDVSAVQNFHLRMTTNFKAIDFPENTLAPSEKREQGSGWQLDWNYRNLLSGYQIAMTMPEKLQPGPLASEISFFAPVSLFFFFFLVFIITTIRHIELHPMNYFFLAAAFFAFHLLLAYLADHLDIHISFAIASAVSIFLVVSYLRLVIGLTFAVREAALAQMIYLVLFSYAFFFKGLTGLAVTIGAIITLFVVMQMTGSVRWSEKFVLPGSPGVSPEMS